MQIAIVLADGFEEIEALVPFDILKRANLKLHLLSINENSLFALSKRNLKVECDDLLLNYNSKDFDVIILPGGIPGADNLASSSHLISILKDMKREGKLICAICAAPARVLVANGIIEREEFACYPSFKRELEGFNYSFKPLVISENFITADGVGSVFDFSFAILEKIKGAHLKDEIKKSLLL